MPSVSLWLRYDFQMSRFHPTSRLILPDNEPDLLAGAVHDSLTRKLYYKLSWSVGLTLIMSILTAGLAPMIAMLTWLRGVIAQHEQQLWHLAEWIRIQTGDPDALALQQSASEIRFRPALAGVTVLGLILAAVGLGMQLQYADLRELYSLAFSFPRSLPGLLFVTGISLAALSNWMHSVMHQVRVRQYLRGFNAMTTKHGLDPIPLAGLDLGVRPLWILGGVILTFTGALWGLPVMLAGGAHRRYTIGTSVLLRSMLAERMRAMLSARKPAIRLPAPVVPARTCVRPNCRAPLVSAAAFCPRCGTRAAALLDVVA